MYRCIVVALHVVFVAIVTEAMPSSLDDILKFIDMDNGVTRYNPQDRRKLVATLRACQCPPRCVKSPRRCFILGICSRCKAPHLGKRSTPDPFTNDQMIIPAVQTERPVSLENDLPSDVFSAIQPEIRTYEDDSVNQDTQNELSDMSSDATRTTSGNPAPIFNLNHEHVPSSLTRIIARMMDIDVSRDLKSGSRILFPVDKVFNLNEENISLEQTFTSDVQKQKRRPMRNPIFLKHFEETDFNSPSDRRQNERESRLHEEAMNFLIKLRKFMSVKYAS